MSQAKFRRALGLVLRQLTEIIVKSVHRATIESRPECRFADRLAAGRSHPGVIIRHTADHMRMGLDVPHSFLNPSSRRRKRPWSLLSEWVHSKDRSGAVTPARPGPASNHPAPSTLPERLPFGNQPDPR